MPVERLMEVWYDLHPDEWVAPHIYAIHEEMERLYGSSSFGIRFNRRAWPKGIKAQRYLIQNITTCFPGEVDGHAEQKAARELSWFGNTARVVLDIHGSESGWDYPFYGESAREDPLAMGLASLLGSEHAIIWDSAGHPAAELRTSYVGFDLRRGTPVLENLEGWLVTIANDGWIPETRPMHEWLYVGEIARSDGLRMRLPANPPRFTRLADAVADELGFPKPLHTVTWNADAHARTGYWGEVVVPYR